ncbi:organic cation transporter protein-like [Saccoglossus kowalevskii]
MTLQFEDILQIIGEFNRFQKIQLCMICIANIPISWLSLSSTFLSASSDHYCRVTGNQTYTPGQSPLKNCTIPYTYSGDVLTWDTCKRYDNNASFLECRHPDDVVTECDKGWVFDRSIYENTVVHEFELVCEWDWMKQLSKSMVGVGQMAGAVVFGQFADIYGRKPLYITGLMLIIVFGVANAFSPCFFLVVIAQFLLAAYGNGVRLTGYVLSIESVGANYRIGCNVMNMVSFSFGYILLAGVAHGLKGNWRHIQLLSGIIFIVFIPYVWYVEESPRWLIQVGNFPRAKKIIKKAAKQNKVVLPENIIMFEKQQPGNNKVNDSLTQYTLIDILKRPRLRLRTLNLCFNWFAVSLVYWAISLNTDTLSGNPYLTFFISGAVEIPSALIYWLLLDKIGRRYMLCGAMVLSGVALVTSGKYGTVSTAFAMIGKFFSSMAFGITYLFSAEIYPTCVRNAGMGISSTSARIGTIIAPFVMLLISKWRPLPFFLMGVCTILAGLLVLLLPETRGQKLPETLEEGELFGRKTSRDDKNTEKSVLISEAENTL